MCVTYDRAKRATAFGMTMQILKSYSSEEWKASLSYKPGLNALQMCGI